MAVNHVQTPKEAGASTDAIRPGVSMSREGPVLSALHMLAVCRLDMGPWLCMILIQSLYALAAAASGQAGRTFVVEPAGPACIPGPVPHEQPHELTYALVPAPRNSPRCVACGLRFCAHRKQHVLL